MILRALSKYPTIPVAEEIWEDLGKAIDYGNGRQVHHPFCDSADLDSMSDNAILAESGGADQDEREAYRAMIEWGREALSDMRGLVELLEDAIAAHKDGDLAACVEALDSASSVEGEYGEEPAALTMRDALLDEEDLGIDDDDE